MAMKEVMIVRGHYTGVYGIIVNVMKFTGLMPMLVLMRPITCTRGAKFYYRQQKQIKIKPLLVCHPTILVLA